MKDYLPLLIAVGQSGAYTSGMNYAPAFDTLEDYGLYIKHAPFTVIPKVKNIISQSWLDQDGEDTFIPRNATFEAYDLDLEFVYCRGDGNANQNILEFIQAITGKWLQIYDSYTQQGRQGVYLVSVDEDPKFQRRGQLDVVIFKAKFRVNDPTTNIVLTKGE